MRRSNMYDQVPMYPTFPMFQQTPMFPMPDIEIPYDDDETRQEIPIGPQGGTTGGPDFDKEPGPPVQESTLYTQGWLTTQIGKYMKFEFLIGTNMLIDREGILLEVGISYIVLRETGSNDLLMCDIYSIKFARVYDDQEKWKCTPDTP